MIYSLAVMKARFVMGLRGLKYRSVFMEVTKTRPTERQIRKFIKEGKLIDKESYKND